MKIRIYSLIFFILLCTACGGLDEETFSNLSDANFYNTEEDAIAAVNAVYIPLTGLPGSLIRATELPTEIATTRLPDAPPGSLDSHRTSDIVLVDAINSVWQICFTGIFRANVVLNRVPDIEMEELTRNRILGEARFLRALYYSYLVRMFSDVPLVEEEITNFSSADDIAALQVPRDPSEAIYDLIFEDLSFAEVNLLNKSETELGRASSESATALLAKIRLDRKEYALAAGKALEVIDSGAYSLVENYADLWNSSGNTEEGIFEIQYGNFPNFPNPATFDTAPSSVQGAIAGTGNSAVVSEYQFFLSFSDGDLRAEPTFLLEAGGTPFVDFEVPTPHFKKFLTLDEIPGKNFPIIRYADILLVAAEALNETQGPDNAYEYVNQVRSRAGLSTLAGLTQEQFADSVFVERRKELCAEGHGWFDSVRFGNLAETVQASSDFNEQFLIDNPDTPLWLEPRGVVPSDPLSTIFPVPNFQIVTNPSLLPQNDGY